MLAAAVSLAAIGCAAPDTAPKDAPHATATAPAAERPATTTPKPQIRAEPAPPVRAKTPAPPVEDRPVHKKVPVSAPAPDAPALPPGERQTGSGIFVPRSIRAGESVSGRVPPGSRVEVDGRSIKVDANGAFRIPAPDRSTDAINLRVFRPGDSRPPMPFRIQILRD